MCAVNDDDLCSPYMLRYVNEILRVPYENILEVRHSDVMQYEYTG